MNGLDYVINYKIEMGWLGFADSHKQLKKVKDAMVVCDNVSKGLIKNFADQDGRGHKIQDWGKIEAAVNSQKTFIRPGSSKAKGWQVTFRGNKPDSFKACLEKGDGYLLMPRGPILLIPLTIIKKFILSDDKDAFKRDTIDIFIRFDDDKIFIAYKKSEIEITKHAIQSYP